MDSTKEASVQVSINCQLQARRPRGVEVGVELGMRRTKVAAEVACPVAKFREWELR